MSKTEVELQFITLCYPNVRCTLSIRLYRFVIRRHILTPLAFRQYIRVIKHFYPLRLLPTNRLAFRLSFFLTPLVHNI